MTPREQALAMIERALPGTRCIVASGKEHQAILITERGTVLPAYELSSKDAIFYAHRAMAQLTPTLLIMEAWQANLTEQDAISEHVQAGRVSVADIPGRAEVIIFNVRIGVEQYIESCPIDRKTGTLARGELIDASQVDLRGRAVGPASGAN